MGAIAPRCSFSEPCQKVRDACDDGKFHGVVCSRIAETVGENTELFHAPDGMFDAHTEAGQGVIVLFFFFCQLSFFWFFVGDVEGGIVLWRRSEAPAPLLRSPLSCV